MELESGQCCGNLRHHVAIASDPSPNIAVAVRLTPTTQKPRLIRRSASSRQSIIHRPLQTMWGVCNAYGVSDCSAVAPVSGTDVRDSRWLVQWRRHPRAGGPRPPSRACSQMAAVSSGGPPSCGASPASGCWTTPSLTANTMHGATVAHGPESADGRMDSGIE
jgi:hypothetical protein